MAEHLLVGSEGERAAMEWLRREGYLIADRNWRSAPHEIDIVAISPDGHYHFVEVKTRHEGSLTTPAEAITRKKISNLLRAANHYVDSHAITAECWIDLAAVTAHPDGTHTVEFIPDIGTQRW